MSETTPETKMVEETPTAADSKAETTTTEEQTAAAAEEAPAAGEETPADAAAPATSEPAVESAETTTAAEAETPAPAAEAAEAAEGAEATEAAKDGEDKSAAQEDSEPKEEPEPEPEPIEIPTGNGELVLVTGATGYLASHIVKLLADGGEYRVRGTVRSLEANEKLDSLKSLLENAKYEPEFVEADLMKPESWTEAVKGCEYVIHVASPFPATQPTEPSEVIEPAKEGTLAVLKACAEAGTVRRVVITSSCAAIYSGRPVTKEALTEEQWADELKSPTPYAQSKTVAEKAAWEYIKELPEGSTMELSVINPGLITGPPLMKMDSSSIEIIKKLMHRQWSMIPKMGVAVIDVRDVALAHIRAMVIKQAAGKRHIVASTSHWLKDIANYLSQEFNSKGFNVATTQEPYVIAWFKSHFDPDVKQVLPECNKLYHFDNSRMTKVLLVEPRPAKDSVVEMAHSLINFGVVQKIEKPEKKGRKLTFRKKKAVKEEGEEKKDEPEKIKDDGSAGHSHDEETADQVKVEVNGINEEVQAEVTETEAKEAEKSAEKAEEEAAPAAAAVEDADKIEATTASSEEEVKEEKPDPESSKSKDKKEKPKEKKKKGLFSFSFKSKTKKQVEKKTEEQPAEEAPAAAAEEAAEEAAKSDETPAAADDAPAAPEAEETPAAAAGDAPAAVEEKPAAEEAEKPAAASEETPAADAPKAN